MNGSSTWNGTSMCWNGTRVCMEIADNASGQSLQKVVSIVVPVFFALIILVGFFGNVMVVIVVLCNRQMRSTTNILIINLAMADLIFIVFCAPSTASEYAVSYWPFGHIWCRIFWYLVYVSACVSIYTLVFLSLERFLAVVHPVASIPIRTKRNAYLAITCVWTVISITLTPVLVTHGEIRNPSALENYEVCAFLVTRGYNFSAFYVPFFMLSYILPLATMFVLYLLMMKKLWFGVTAGSQFGIRSKTRVTRLIVVVIVIFAVCWSPVQIAFLLRSVQKFENNASNVILRIVAETLAYFNSCVNPILYAFLSENFRKAFRKLLNRSPLWTCRSCTEAREQQSTRTSPTFSEA